MLYQFDTGDLPPDFIGAGQQHKGGGSGTDQQCVHINAEGLDQALFGRMGHKSSGRRVRHGAFTGFIGEQAPLDTVHDAGAKAAGYGSLRSKGIADD